MLCDSIQPGDEVLVVDPTPGGLLCRVARVATATQAASESVCRVVDDTKGSFRFGGTHVFVERI